MKAVAEFIRSVTRPTLVISWLYMTFYLAVSNQTVNDTLLVAWVGVGVTMVGWWFYDRSKKTVTP